MSQQVIFTGANLFTGIDESVIKNGTIWLDGEHIKYAGPADGLIGVDASIKCVELKGQFVMPGMTECHAHLSFTDANPFNLGAQSPEEATLTGIRNARIMLGSGFTSAISFGSIHKVDLALRSAINSGAIPGPRLAAAGKDLGATGSTVDSGVFDGLAQVADGPWAVRKAVREQRRDTVDIVKIFIDGEGVCEHATQHELSFQDDEVAAIVDEAHRHGMRVACHSRSAAGVKQAVRAGVDFIAHANFLDEEAADMLYAARDHVYVAPSIIWELGLIEQCESLGLSSDWVKQRGYEEEVEASIRSVRMMLDRDIRLMVGGDFGISVAPHGTYAKDLEVFVDIFGMSAAKALLCATRDGGSAFDRSNMVGTLEAGKYADLLIIDGDPIENIKVMQEHSKFSAIIKGGLIYQGLINDADFTISPDRILSS
jgi:imidazolonepropionase-like amidohydrolase